MNWLVGLGLAAGIVLLLYEIGKGAAGGLKEFFSHPFGGQSDSPLVNLIQSQRASGKSDSQIVDDAIQQLRANGYSWQNIYDMAAVGNQVGLFGNNDLQFIYSRINQAVNAEAAGATA